jgi:ligand-binding SRPBCC domain-containing protein
MRFARTVHLPAPPSKVWAAVERPATMAHVAAPLVIFRTPRGHPPLPERWTEGRWRVSLQLFGLLPVGGQWIGIEPPDRRGDAWFLRDNGVGDLIHKWDHRIMIEPDGTGGTRYTDSLDIEAGLLTPFIWLFAYGLFAWRQRRLRVLAERGFRF